jgi:2-isopropylmalate synthase
LVLGKHSGRAALSKRLENMGLAVTETDMGKLFDAFKTLADKKKEIYDGDLIALVEEVVRGNTLAAWTVDYLHTASASGTGAGSGAMATATVRLKKGDQIVTDAATGDGPVDAVVQAVNRICGYIGTVEDYRLRAVTRGGDALGEVSIRVRLKNAADVAGEGTVVGGKGLSTDIVHASALAYLDAVNRVAFEIGRLDYRTATA